MTVLRWPCRAVRLFLAVGVLFVTAMGIAASGAAAEERRIETLWIQDVFSLCVGSLVRHQERILIRPDRVMVQSLGYNNYYRGRKEVFYGHQLHYSIRKHLRNQQGGAIFLGSGASEVLNITSPLWNELDDPGGDRLKELERFAEHGGPLDGGSVLLYRWQEDGRVTFCWMWGALQVVTPESEKLLLEQLASTEDLDEFRHDSFESSPTMFPDSMGSLFNRPFTRIEALRKAKQLRNGDVDMLRATSRALDARWQKFKKEDIPEDVLESIQGGPGFATAVVFAGALEDAGIDPTTGSFPFFRAKFATDLNGWFPENAPPMLWEPLPPPENPDDPPVSDELKMEEFVLLDVMGELFEQALIDLPVGDGPLRQLPELITDDDWKATNPRRGVPVNKAMADEELTECVAESWSRESVTYLTYENVVLGRLSVYVWGIPPGTIVQNPASPAVFLKIPAIEELERKYKQQHHGFAKAVIGKPGFVLSPFTEKAVAAKGKAGFTVMSDPADPDAGHRLVISPMANPDLEIDWDSVADHVPMLWPREPSVHPAAPPVPFTPAPSDPRGVVPPVPDPADFPRPPLPGPVNFEARPSKPEPKDHPVAKPVPNRPGFVISPYTNKVIDVRSYPSGSRIEEFDPQDPTGSSIKVFRVP